MYSLAHICVTLSLSIDVQMGVSSVLNFLNPTKGESAAFFSPGEQNPGRFEAVRNNHQVYGAVVGDGLLVDVTSQSNPAPGASALGNFTVCWRVTASLSQKQKNRFVEPRVALAIGKFRAKLIPQSSWFATFVGPVSVNDSSTAQKLLLNAGT